MLTVVVLSLGGEVKIHLFVFALSLYSKAFCNDSTFLYSKNTSNIFAVAF
jgi:hypothetical protein